jgi:hypothetical protein
VTLLEALGREHAAVRCADLVAGLDALAARERRRDVTQ